VGGDRDLGGARLMRHLASSLLVLVLAAIGTGPMAAAEAGPPVVIDADGNAVTIEDATRVATLGGVFTETAYALGAADQIVAVDASSYYPPEALAEKPDLGYYRFLSAESVLAQAPSLIVGNVEAGPPEVIEQLRGAGVPVLLLPDGNDVSSARELITTLGTVFGREAEAEVLVAGLDADVAAAQALVDRATSHPRVLFVLQPPDAPLLVSGEDSAAGHMIDLAGGVGYIPMTPEGIVQTAPEVILTTTDSVDQLGGLEALLAHPGVAQTPAAADDRVYVMEDLYLMGFGPRTGQAIADLARLLHPELAS
jgi:iron complex transport system substrate-binding protein